MDQAFSACEGTLVRIFQDSAQIKLIVLAGKLRHAHQVEGIESIGIHPSIKLLSRKTPLHLLKLVIKNKIDHVAKLFVSLLEVPLKLLFKIWGEILRNLSRHLPAPDCLLELFVNRLLRRSFPFRLLRPFSENSMKVFVQRFINIHFRQGIQLAGEGFVESTGSALFHPSVAQGIPKLLLAPQKIPGNLVCDL